MSNEEKILEMLSTLTVTVNGVQADLQEVKQRLGNVENRLDNVESRLNNLEKNVENIKEKQIAFEEFITDNLFAKDGLIQYMDNKFNDLQAEFDVLNNRQHATDIQVAKLRRIK